MIAVVLLAMPSVVMAQGGRRGGGGMMPSPLQIVLEKKADLALTAEQVTKLEESRKALDELNAPHTAEMQKIMQAGMPPSEEDRAKMRTLRESIQKNNTDAREKLKDVLNPEQLAAANRFIDEAAPRGRRGGGGR